MLFGSLAVSSRVHHWFNGHKHVGVRAESLKVLQTGLIYPMEFHGNLENSFVTNGTVSRFASCS